MGLHLTFVASHLSILHKGHKFLYCFRLEKYPMTFLPNEADNKVIILPLTRDLEIDWTFVRTIETFKDVKLEPVSDEARCDFFMSDRLTFCTLFKVLPLCRWL